MAELPGNSPLLSARSARASNTGGDEMQFARPVRTANIEYGSKRFLVIDAVQEMRSAMNATLSTFGVNKIDYANRAVEAIGMIKRTDYDIVLCDFDLGRGLDGMHLLEEVRMRNILKPSAVFMIVTGERRARMVISAAEMAPDDYLLKPFTGQDLKQRLDRIYKKKIEFEALDAAMLNQDFLRAIAECNERIAKRDPFLLDFLKMKGRIAFLIGDYKLAKETYTTVLNAREIPWAKMGLAKALFHLKDYAESRRLFDELLIENNRVMEAYDWLAKIHQAEHEYVEAQAVLARAVALSPAIVQRQKKLGDVAMKNGDYETAVAAFQQTINLAKYSFWRDAGDYMSLSKAQLGAGDLIEATKTASEVRREFRNDQKAEMLASLMECQAALSQGSDARAGQLLTKAKAAFASISGGVPDQYSLELAETCFKAGEEDAATEIVKKVLKNHHEDVTLLDRVSTLFDQVGRPDLGQEMIEANARAIVTINNEAVMMAQAGDLDGAVRKFIKAVEEMPSNAQVMLNAINAMLAYVARKGWQEEYMTLAHQYLERVKIQEPASVKYLKLKEAYAVTRRRFRV